MRMWVLSLTALCHNYAFWGVVSLFPVYLTQALGYGEGYATERYGLMLGTAMVFPLVGGYVATFLGRESLLVPLGLLILTVGCILLAASTDESRLFALALVVVGYGVFWPSVLALVGRIHDELPSRRDQGFTNFYAVGSIGILLTQVLGYAMVERFGWSWLYLSLAIVGFLGCVLSTIRCRDFGVLDTCKSNERSAVGTRAPKTHTQIQKNNVRVILALAGFSIVFWMGCSQMGSSVVFFAENYVHRRLFSVDIPPTVFLSFFALTVILLGPLVARLWFFLERRKLHVGAPRKMAAALVLLAMSFSVLALASLRIDEGGEFGHVSSLYLFAFFFLQAAGAIVMAPIGLAFVTRWAPVHLAGPLTGMWLFATGLGVFLGGITYDALSNIMSPLFVFGSFLLVDLAAACILFAVSHQLMGLLRDGSQAKDRQREADFVETEF